MTLWHDARVLNSIANVLIMAALAAFASTAVWWLAHRPVFDLHDIEVSAVQGRTLERLDPAQLREAGLNRVDGSFFSVDLHEVRRRFESAPWVRRAEVRRVWPNRLQVAVEEHRPLASWGDGRLVNTFGELFEASLPGGEDESRLIAFAGPEGTQRMVAERYAELERELRAIDMRPRAVNLSERQAWSAELDNGITLLIGREEGVDVMERVARWAAVHPQVQARLNERTEVIDLRYPNGFAIRAPGALETDAQFGKRKHDNARGVAARTVSTRQPGSRQP
ncbi:MAG: cell division protein FtsQ/DivIB [Lautropia sp.]